MLKPAYLGNVSLLGADVNKLCLGAPLGALLLAAQAFAADPDPAIEKFRAAYTSGNGLAYVVITNAKGERVYRYGDTSREAAKKDTRRFLLFTCAVPHVFDTDRVSHRSLLAGAKVVQAGEPGFAELDARYLKGCRNPLVKSALPPAK
jgi:hypothetical protein